MTVHVTSEIGRLRSVVVHTPGDELLGVTPTTREDYLYDDLPDAYQAAEGAPAVHRDPRAVLRRSTRCATCSSEVVENREVRELLVRETMDIVPSEPLAREIEALPRRPSS